MIHDEYDDEKVDAGGVPPAGGASNGSGLRTFDRRAIGIVAALLFVAAAAYLGVIHSARQSMATVVAAAPPPAIVTSDNTSLRLPAAPTSSPVVVRPTPLARPTVVATERAVAMVAEEEAPQSGGGGGGAATQAQPKQLSPEEVFAQEERRRVLEARRASTRVELDTTRAAQPEALGDGGDLAQAQPEGATATDASDASATTPRSRSEGPHAQFLAQQRGTIGYLPRQSPYELRRGTIINARWMTTLDSTLPGGVLKAMVTESVKDSLTHSVVVLPAGTILTGAGDAQTVEGEARYLCAFDELELPAPDSRTFYMGSNPGSGRQGENGVDVGVDTHAGRDFGHSVLYSVLQAGVNLASRASTVVDLGSGSSQVLQQNQRSAPTFHAYVGQPLTIVVAQTLPLDRFQETAR